MARCSSTHDATASCRARWSSSDVAGVCSRCSDTPPRISLQSSLLLSFAASIHRADSPCETKTITCTGPFLHEVDRDERVGGVDHGRAGVLMLRRIHEESSERILPRRIRERVDADSVGTHDLNQAEPLRVRPSRRVGRSSGGSECATVPSDLSQSVSLPSSSSVVRLRGSSRLSFVLWLLPLAVVPCSSRAGSGSTCEQGGRGTGERGHRPACAAVGVVRDCPAGCIASSIRLPVPMQSNSAVGTGRGQQDKRTPQEEEDTRKHKTHSEHLS